MYAYLQRLHLLSVSLCLQVLRLRGGGPANFEVPFTDISQQSTALAHAFDQASAAPWRMAQPGLCIEGYCENPSCQANGQLVIDNKGFTHFDLMLEAAAGSCRCPSCSSVFQPLTCAFNNCGEYITLHAPLNQEWEIPFRSQQEAHWGEYSRGCGCGCRVRVW
jgi:hypothetical protein